MRRSFLFAAACLTILSATACAPSSAPAVHATYQATTLKGDPSVTFNTTGDTLLIDVVGPSGIGGSAIEKTSGQWPSKIVVRLHLKGLEKFHLQYGANNVDVTISSQGDHAVHEVYSQPGEISAVSAGDPYWIAVTPGQGYFDLQMPSDFLKSGENRFTIDWIDFYR
jgi:hypothetical protein